MLAASQRRSGPGSHACALQPRARALPPMQVPVPSLHVFGNQDYIKEHCIELVRRFRNPVVLIHPRGHVIPEPVDYHLAAMRAFLQVQMQQARL